jgi:hypothetical protein
VSTDTCLSRVMAQRLSEASVLMEQTTHSELGEMLRLGANEIERLAAVVENLRKTTNPSPPSGGWQPIESAPKDGTEVIVGVDIASVWITRGAFYVAPGERDSDDSVGWWSYKHSVTQEKLDDIYEPTHWLPMPETPSDREDRRIAEANQ